MNKISKTYAILIAYSSFILSACNGKNQDRLVFPPSREEIEDKRIGSLIGNDGFKILGLNKKTKQSKGYKTKCDFDSVWHAVLNSLSESQIMFVDKEAGIVVTHWQYSNDAKEKEI